jgi:hypothetical protein
MTGAGSTAGESDGAARRKGLRAALRSALDADEKDFERAVADLAAKDGRKLVGPLFSGLFSLDERIRWRAVRAVGIVTARIADEEMEAARDVMRRLIWNLNDESGGIGWGCAEAMGEIMARHARVAEEFAPILVSYVRESCNRPENRALERGALWGIGRLAGVRPHLAVCCIPDLAHYLESPDAEDRGLAAWILGLVEPGEAGDLPARFAHLAGDDAVVRIACGGEVNAHRVGDLMALALKRAEGAGPGLPD